MHAVIIEGTEQDDSLGYSHKETYTRVNELCYRLVAVVIDSTGPIAQHLQSEELHAVPEEQLLPQLSICVWFNI